MDRPPGTRFNDHSLSPRRDILSRTTAAWVERIFYK